jgi:hypothetical protein
MAFTNEFNQLVNSFGGGGASLPQPSGSGSNPTKSDLLQYANDHAASIGINQNVATRQMMNESGGKANVVSYKGAFGPMQLMPGTAKELANKYGGDPSDPYDNIRLGQLYYRDLRNKFGSDELALAAYHAGPGAVSKAGGIPNTSDGLSTTRQYVQNAIGGGAAQPAFEAAPAKRNQASAFSNDFDALVQSFGSPQQPATISQPRTAKVDAEKFPTIRAGMAQEEKAQATRDAGRSVFEKTGDVFLALTSGVYGIGEAAGTLYGVASGDMDNKLRTFSRDVQGAVREAQSDYLKQIKLDRDGAIKAQDSWFGQFSTTAGETLGSPALVADFVAEQLPQLILAGVVGRGVGAGAKMLGAGEKLAASAGTEAAIGAGGVMQGTQAAGGAYDQIKKLYQDNPDLIRNSQTVQRMIASGMSEAEAIDRAARTSALMAGASSGFASLLLNKLPGAASLERALVGQAGKGATTKLGGFVKGGIGEGFGEGTDEAFGQVAQNAAVKQFDPSQSLTEGTAENAAMGALFAPLGAVSGMAEAGQAPNATQPGNTSQGMPTAQAPASAAPSVAPPAQPSAQPAPSIEQISAARDQVSARIAAVQQASENATSETAQAIQSELAGLAQKRDELTAQLQQAVASGAANPAAEPQQVIDPSQTLADRAKVLTEFLANKQESRALREADPGAFNEFLRAYRVALNPQMDTLLRVRALNDIDAFLDRSGYQTSAGAVAPVPAPAAANIVPYGANQAQVRPGDPQGRMVADAAGNVRPAYMNEVQQPDPNVIDGQVTRASTELVTPAASQPLQADMRGNVGEAQAFDQMREQAQRGDELAQRMTQGRIPALPYKGDALAAAQPGAGIPFSLKQRLQRADMRMRGINPDEVSNAITPELDAGSNSAERDNGARGAGDSPAVAGIGDGGSPVAGTPARRGGADTPVGTAAPSGVDGAAASGAALTTKQKLIRAMEKGSTPKNLLQFINQNGGIAIGLKSDINQDAKIPGLFRKGGRSLDSLAELLEQNGYLAQGEIDSDGATSGGNRVIELAQRALSGERILSLNDIDKSMSNDTEERYRGEIRADAKRFGIKTAFRKFSEVELDVLNAREWEIDREVDELDQAQFDAYNLIVADLRNAIGDNAEAMLEDLASELGEASASEYYAVASKRIEKAINDSQTKRKDAAGTGQTNAGRPGESAEAGGRKGNRSTTEDGFSLEAQTSQDLASKAAREADQSLADKQQADAQREAFSLDAQTGGFAPTMSQGADLFGGPSVADLQNSQSNAKSVKEKLQRVFGDKTSPAALREAGARAFAEGKERNSWMTEPWARDSRGVLREPSDWLRGWGEAKTDADLIASREGRDVLTLPSEFPTAEVDASYSHISHNGSGRARFDRDAFVSRVHELYDEAMAKAETPAQQQAAKDAAINFKVEYLRRLQPVIRVRSQTYSGHIAGRAKLNAKQADSRNSALDKALDTFFKWEKGSAGYVMQAVLRARSPEQLQSIAEARAEKEFKRKASMLKTVAGIDGFKPGEVVKFGSYNIARVSRDRDGYPSSVTVDATDLTDNKFDLARTLFDGDKAKLRAAVDEARQNQSGDATEMVDQFRGATKMVNDVSAQKGTDATQPEQAPAQAEEARGPEGEARASSAKPAAAVGDFNPAAPMTLAGAEESEKRLDDGLLTANELRARWASFRRDQEAIRAELAKLTKAALLDRLDSMSAQRYKNENKDEVIDKALGNLAFGFRPSTGDNFFSYSGRLTDAIDRAVQQATDEAIAAHAGRIADARNARKEQAEAYKSAVADPKSLEDFRAFIRANAKEGMTYRDVWMMLTPEQRANFDELAGEASREARNYQKDQRATEVRAAGQLVDGKIIETKHTKLGHDLFVVQLAERVSREDYDTLNTGAKKLGGGYSSYRGNGATPGFQFRSMESAEAFVKLAGGDTGAAQEAAQARRDAFADDKSQSAAERLTEMAERLDERADESLNRDRKANTARRASFAASAEASANADKALAATMRNTAAAIQNGTAKFLDRVRQKTQVEFLSERVSSARYEHWKETDGKKDGNSRPIMAPLTGEVADYAEFPAFTAFRSDLARLGRDLQSRDGLKKLGKQLLSVADDITDAYTKFAKENFHKVVYGAKGGGTAGFKTSAQAEAAIDRSNVRGRAIPLQIKRGEWAVVMSPEMAREHGVWEGDDDKRITLKADFGKELMEKIGAANKSLSRLNQIDAPWQFSTANERIGMLSRMGIETAAEFRAALREFIGLREAPQEADKIKQLERSMVGRKNDGLDFFPTSPAVVSEMLDAAEIEPGMRVLEPSAGMGHIAEQIRDSGIEPEVVEFSPERRELLEAKGFNVVGRDFMEFSQAQDRGFTYGDVFRAPDGVSGVMRGSNGMGSGRVGFQPLQEKGEPDTRIARYENFSDLEGVERRGVDSGYDRIIMNPPFSNGRDIEHVRHAYELLKPGGRIVAIMGEGAFYRQDKKAEAFRAWLDDLGGTSEKLPEGSFMDPSLPVNTSVNARMVVIEKPDSGTALYSRQQESIGSIISRILPPSSMTGDEAVRKLLAPNDAGSVEQVRKELGAEIDLNSSDKLQIVQSIADLPKKFRDELFQQKNTDTQGIYSQSEDKIFLVADNIKQGEAFAVLMHEAGVHMGLRNFIGDENFRKLATTVKMWATTEPNSEQGRLARLAKDRIPKDTPAKHRDEELVAYFVTEAVKAGHGEPKPTGDGPIKRWFDKLWAAVKTALEKLGVAPETMTAGDVVALARGALEKTLGKDGSAYSSTKSDTLHSKAKEGASSAYAFTKNADGSLSGDGLSLSPAKRMGKNTAYRITDESGEQIGFVITSGKDGAVAAIENIKMIDSLRGTGYGERVVRGLLAYAGELDLQDIKSDAIGFWKNLGATWRNYSTDPSVQMDGKLSWNDYAKARIEKAAADERKPGSANERSAERGNGPADQAGDDWLRKYLGEEGGEIDEGSLFSVASRVKTQLTEDSTSEVVGQSGRNYTPEQRAFFENTGREIDKPTWKSRWQSLWKDAGKKLAQGLADQFAPIKEITEKGYMLARLSKGAAGAFQALLEHGKLSIRDGVYDADQSGGVTERLFKPLQGEGEDFLWWVAANRAERLSGEGRENLFAAADIAAGRSLADGVTDFDYTLQHDVGGKQAGTVTRDRTLIYQDSSKILDEFNRNVLDVAEQSGLIDGGSRSLWEHEFYVPFYRVSEEDQTVNFANIKGSLVRQKAFDKLKGGTEKINSDLMANVLNNWAHLIDASAKNRAARETLSEAESVGVARKALPGETKTVWYSQDGQKVEFIVEDPFVMTAISSLAYAGLRGPMMDAMSAFKHSLTIGVTASPFFKIRNLIRDSLQAISVSELGYNPVENVKQGWKASDRKNQSYVSLLASGGIIKFGSMLEGKESSRIRRLVSKGVDRASILDEEHKIRAFYDKYLAPAVDAYQELGDRGEEVNRAALYQQLTARGIDHATASFMARDLMDFSMQGSWSSIRFLTQVVPFMNARIQGLYKLGKGAKEDPRKFGYVLGAVALASIGLMLAYKDDDDWKKREDWDRDSYWWFKVGGEAFRIPKPFEIGAIGSLAERGVEYFATDEMTGERFMIRFTSLLADNLSMNPIPQLVKPLLDVYANKDSFSGRPIETMGMERLQSDQRFTQSTSMAARAASTAGNAITGVIGKEFLSPVQIDQMIRGYFGWLGTFVVGTADQLARPLADQPARPAMDYWKTATGGIVSSLDGASSRYVTNMYDQAKVLEEAYGTWRQMLKDGRLEDAEEFAKDNTEKLGRYKQVERVKNAASKLNKQIREIERGDLDPAEKRDRINEVRSMRDRLARALSVSERR